MIVVTVWALAVLQFSCHLAYISAAAAAPAVSDFVINENAIRLMFQRQHNLWRIHTANGFHLKGKRYGPASNMYRLSSSYDLAGEALSELETQIPTSLQQVGKNYYHKVIKKGTHLHHEAKNAVKHWLQSTGSFHQMILASATYLGCAYKLSNIDGNNEEMLLEMKCLYDKKYTSGDPYTKGKPCQKNSDCTTYNPSSCDRKYHICDKK